MDQISKLWQSRAYSTDAIIAEAYSTAPGIATPEAPAENQPSAKTLRQISPEDKERYEEEMRSYTPSEDFKKRKAEFEDKAKVSSNQAFGQQGGGIHDDYFTYLLLNWRQVKV